MFIWRNDIDEWAMVCVSDKKMWKKDNKGDNENDIGEVGNVGEKGRDGGS